MYPLKQYFMALIQVIIHNFQNILKYYLLTLSFNKDCFASLDLFLTKASLHTSVQQRLRHIVMCFVIWRAIKSQKQNSCGCQPQTNIQFKIEE